MREGVSQWTGERFLLLPVITIPFIHFSCRRKKNIIRYSNSSSGSLHYHPWWSDSGVRQSGMTAGGCSVSHAERLIRILFVFCLTSHAYGIRYDTCLPATGKQSYYWKRETDYSNTQMISCTNVQAFKLHQNSDLLQIQSCPQAVPFHYALISFSPLIVRAWGTSLWFQSLFLKRWKKEKADDHDLLINLEGNLNWKRNRMKCNLGK
jgi:hypothetical protein